MNRHEAAINYLQEQLEAVEADRQDWKDYSEALLEDLNSSRTTIEALREELQQARQGEEALKEELQQARQGEDSLWAMLNAESAALARQRKDTEEIRCWHAYLKERHEALFKLSQEQTEEIAKLRQQRDEALDNNLFWKDATLEQAQQAKSLEEELQQARQEALEAKEEALQQRRHLEQRIGHWRHLAVKQCQEARNWADVCAKRLEQDDQ